MPLVPHTATRADEFAALDKNPHMKKMLIQLDELLECGEEQFN